LLLVFFSSSSPSLSRARSRRSFSSLLSSNPFVRVGLPFLTFLTVGSFLLSNFIQQQYQYQQQQQQWKSAQSQLGQRQQAQMGSSRSHKSAKRQQQQDRQQQEEEEEEEDQQQQLQPESSASLPRKRPTLEAEYQDWLGKLDLEFSNKRIPRPGEPQNSNDQHR